jgi:hypothetical protein
MVTNKTVRGNPAGFNATETITLASTTRRSESIYCFFFCALAALMI